MRVSGRGPLLAVVALATGVRCWLLARPIAALDGRALPDDAYIAMEIARNIGSGDGPRFVDYLTNGFQPLFVWLASIPFALTAPGTLDPGQLDFAVKCALAISCGFDLGALVLLALAVERGSGDRNAGVLAGLIWALQPAVLRIAVNGLETATAIFFLMWLWNAVLRHPFATSAPRRLFAHGVIAGVGAMARIDLLLVGSFFAIESIRSIRQTGCGPRARTEWLARNFALALGTLLGFAPWIVYSLFYTGRIVPESGRAVRWISLTHAGQTSEPAFTLRMLAEGIAAIDANLPCLGKLAALGVLLALAGSLWQRKRRSRTCESLRLGWLALPGAFGLAVLLVYALYVHADWFFPRYLAPLNPLAIATVATLLAALVARVPARARAVWTLAALAAIGVATLQPRFRDLMFAPPDAQRGYRNLGLWARETFAPGTVLGATQAGALAYYAADYRVVNLDGVVNAHAADALVAGRAMQYIRDEGIDYVVAWRRNYDFLASNSDGFRASDLPLAGYIDHFRSWGIQWQLYRVAYPDGRLPPALRSDPR